MSAKVLLAYGVWAAYDLTELGWRTSPMPRQSEADGASHGGDGTGLPGLMPVPFISSTKSSGSNSPSYLWSNYPEKSGEDRTNANTGNLLWATALPVTGQFFLGFNHVNKTGSSTALKLLLRQNTAGASASIQECRVMGGSINDAIRYGRLIVDAHPFAQVIFPSSPAMGASAWGQTALPYKSASGVLVPSGLLSDGQMISGRVKMTITGNAYVGLAMLDPGTNFPDAGELPSTALQRSRRRGQVASYEQALVPSTTVFDFGGDPATIDFSTKGGYWTSFCGIGSAQNSSWESTPNETWIGVTKWEMNQGDDELWGDYMVRTTIPEITVKTTTPQFPVEVVLALVPIDDLGAGWTGNPVFSSNVTLYYSGITSYMEAGAQVTTIPKNAYNGAFNSIASRDPETNLPNGRHFGLLAKWVLGGTVNGQARPSQATWSGSFEICNGSGGWFALVLMGRGLQVEQSEEPD